MSQQTILVNKVLQKVDLSKGTFDKSSFSDHIFLVENHRALVYFGHFK